MTETLFQVGLRTPIAVDDKGNPVFAGQIMVDLFRVLGVRTGGVAGVYPSFTPEGADRILGFDGTTEGTVTWTVAASFFNDNLSLNADKITAGEFADDRISENSVTQHQTALVIGASQVQSGTFANARISASSVTQHALPNPTISAQTEDYTLTASDRYKVVTMDNMLARTITIGSGLTGWTECYRKGTGTVTVQGDTGVTVNGVSGGSVMIALQWGRVKAQNIGTNEWIVS